MSLENTAMDKGKQPQSSLYHHYVNVDWEESVYHIPIFLDYSASTLFQGHITSLLKYGLGRKKKTSKRLIFLYCALINYSCSLFQSLSLSQNWDCWGKYVIYTIPFCLCYEVMIMKSIDVIKINWNLFNLVFLVFVQWSHVVRLSRAEW